MRIVKIPKIGEFTCPDCGKKIAESVHPKLMRCKAIIESEGDLRTWTKNDIQNAIDDIENKEGSIKEVRGCIDKCVDTNMMVAKDDLLLHVENSAVLHIDKQKFERWFGKIL